MIETQGKWSKSRCEYLRSLAKQKFQQVRSTWIECGRWALPHRIKWLLSQTPGERNNYHIVDPTHILSLRSYVAGFLEGNTSASRPWYRVQASAEESNLVPENHKWLDGFSRRTLKCLGDSNFYQAAGQFYYDFGTFNTGSLFIEEMKGGKLYFHNLIPGSYYVINDARADAIILVREMSLSVAALVDQYGKRGDWSNISRGTRKMYEDGNYTQLVDVVQIVMENQFFDPKSPIGGQNRKWVSLTYEAGRNNAQYTANEDDSFGDLNIDPIDKDKDVYLSVTFSKRKPFIIGVSDRNSNFEYGEKGPTLDALGLIRSLNKKAIAKDQALEQMLKPALQGPANLKKSYITTAANSYVPLDANSLAQKGLRPVFEINPAIGAMVQDVGDLRQQIGQLYYADYLLYLSRNPKTRTAAETNAVVQEQQLVIGPNLQSLNWTFNVPVVEFVMDFVLDNDEFLPPPPEGLAGQFLRTEFVSVFAQAMKAADLPSIERYMGMVEQVGQLPGGAHIWDKVNLDKLADLYEDRLFLPEGLNKPQAQVDAMRQQAQAAAERNQAITQHLPAMAGAAKDLGMQAPQGQPQ